MRLRRSSVVHSSDENWIRDRNSVQAGDRPRMKEPGAELIFLLVARPAVRSTVARFAAEQSGAHCSVAHFVAEQPAARCSVAHFAAEQPAARCSAAHFAAEQPAARCPLASK